MNTVTTNIRPWGAREVSKQSSISSNGAFGTKRALATRTRRRTAPISRIR